MLYQFSTFVLCATLNFFLKKKNNSSNFLSLCPAISDKIVCKGREPANESIYKRKYKDLFRFLLN